MNNFVSYYYIIYRIKIWLNEIARACRFSFFSQDLYFCDMYKTNLNLTKIKELKSEMAKVKLISKEQSKRILDQKDKIAELTVTIEDKVNYQNNA